MINNQPDQGETIIREGIASGRLQAFFDSITDEANNRNFTVATVPDATVNEGRIIYVSDESGGSTLAFSDGTNWRRVQDRAIIS